MRLSWNLGRISGIDLFLHPSALLMFFVVHASGHFSSGLVTLAVVVALFGSIVLHELGHALMARAYGIGTADITLYLFGGVASLKRMPRSSGPELLIALAGPAVNFAIVLALLAVQTIAGGLRFPPSEFLGVVIELNLGLALLNLLPVFPMDGGRVLRALLALPLGRLKATEIAAFLGRSIAICAAFYCLVNGLYQPLILAMFVYMAGSMELRQVRSEGRPDGQPAGLIDIPPAPDGFRWADRGDGIWRLVPVMVHVGLRDRSWY